MDNAVKRMIYFVSSIPEEFGVVLKFHSPTARPNILVQKLTKEIAHELETKHRSSVCASVRLNIRTVWAITLHCMNGFQYNLSEIFDI